MPALTKPPLRSAYSIWLLAEESQLFIRFISDFLKKNSHRQKSPWASPIPLSATMLASSANQRQEPAVLNAVGGFNVIPTNQDLVLGLENTPTWNSPCFPPDRFCYPPDIWWITPLGACGTKHHKTSGDELGIREITALNPCGTKARSTKNLSGDSGATDYARTK